MHINRSFGTTSLAFLEDYNVYLAKRAVRRILGDCVARKEPVTIEILFKLFSQYSISTIICMFVCALYFFSFRSCVYPV